MRDLTNQESGFVSGAGSSPYPPSRGSKSKASKGKSSKSRISSSKGKNSGGYCG
jgi:hypothetical protein